MDAAVPGIAAAIGDPARACMLYSLVDGRARTSTELAIVAEVSPSTASAHLKRLEAAHLVKVLAQGKHRYYSLQGAHVARCSGKALSVLAGRPRDKFVPNTPKRLCAARTCYDHIAGTLGVAIHDRLHELKWLSRYELRYDLTPQGTTGLEELGIDLDEARGLRRQFACPCLDWSERRPHIGGALGAAILAMALKRKWVSPDLDSRALTVTSTGQREMLARLGVRIQKC